LLSPVSILMFSVFRSPSASAFIGVGVWGLGSPTGAIHIYKRYLCVGVLHKLAKIAHSRLLNELIIQIRTHAHTCSCSCSLFVSYRGVGDAKVCLDSRFVAVFGLILHSILVLCICADITVEMWMNSL
jgi:hypothetical protein